MINSQTKKVSVLKNFVAYRKSKIVSALDVFDNQNPELLLSYSHTSLFVQLQEGLSEVVSFHWNNAPTNIACAFPFLLGFSENSIEIRLLVNGNLVHTLCVPGVKLITCKNDIFFTSCKSNIPTLDREKNKVLGNTSFSKIRLADLAGFDTDNRESADGAVEVTRDSSKRSLPRNVGVYESVKKRDGHSFRRLDDTTRSFSAAASLSCPTREPLKENRLSRIDALERSDISSLDDSSVQERMSSLKLKTQSSVELSNTTNCPSALNKKLKENVRLSGRASIDCSNICYSEQTGDPNRPISCDPSSQTSFFYTTRNVVVHSQQTPTRERGRERPSQSRENIPYCSPQNLEFEKGKPLRGSVRDNFQRMEFYDPTVQYGTKGQSSPTYNVDIIASDPFHKQTTIV